MTFATVLATATAVGVRSQQPSLHDRLDAGLAGLSGEGILDLDFPSPPGGEWEDRTLLLVRARLLRDAAPTPP